MPAQGADQVCSTFSRTRPWRSSGTRGGSRPTRACCRSGSSTRNGGSPSGWRACLTVALAGRVRSLTSMVRQRVFGTVAGYEDRNDHDQPRDEPAFKMLAGRPMHGHQQRSLFHGYYGQYQCYPLVISEMTTRHVFLAQLRHGTAHASLGGPTTTR